MKLRDLIDKAESCIQFMTPRVELNWNIGERNLKQQDKTEWSDGEAHINNV